MRRTACALIVMPRSRSRSMESNTCAIISLCDRAPVNSKRRSARVDLPWSMCAMIEKLRITAGSMRYDEAEPPVSHMSYSHITFEAPVDGVAVLTVTRPHNLNALNRGPIDELDRAFTEVQNSAPIRGLILTPSCANAS